MVRNLLAVRLQAGRIEPLACAAVPEYLNDFFSPVADSLREAQALPARDFADRWRRRRLSSQIALLEARNG